MNQPFEVGKRKTSIQHSVIVEAGRFAGVGIGLPDEFAVGAQEKADLLERRLVRLEKELGLNPLS